MTLTISPRPWHATNNPDGTVTIRDNVQNEIGTMKDWRDAELMIQNVNADGKCGSEAKLVGY